MSSSNSLCWEKSPIYLKSMLRKAIENSFLRLQSSSGNILKTIM